MFEKKIIENPLRKGSERKESERVYQVLKREVNAFGFLICIPRIVVQYTSVCVGYVNINRSTYWFINAYTYSRHLQHIHL